MELRNCGHSLERLVLSVIFGVTPRECIPELDASLSDSDCPHPIRATQTPLPPATLSRYPVHKL